VLQRVLKARSSSRGETIERIRMYELTSEVAFLGRRRRVYNRLVALSGARPGDQVLDVGCNGGYQARLLAAAVTPGGQVTGVDPSGPAISYATRRGPGNTKFAVGVAQDLGWPEDSFDVVTCTLAVHHIPEPVRADAFGEMYRVTRPGGRLLVADFRPSGWHRGVHGMRHADATPLSDLAEAAGFRVETTGDLPLLRYLRAVRPGSRPDASAVP
jgi:ubiquinone/menaquinone biosynthesis C-methylase UbiE